MPKPLIYISHPYKGIETNKLIVGKIIKDLYSYYSDRFTFVSPIHCFSFLYNEVNYFDGLDMCYDLLEGCVEMWVFGDYKNSTGCKAEISYCKTHDIPYKIFKNVNSVRKEYEPNKSKKAIRKKIYKKRRK